LRRLAGCKTSSTALSLVQNIGSVPLSLIFLQHAVYLLVSPRKIVLSRLSLLVYLFKSVADIDTDPELGRVLRVFDASWMLYLHYKHEHKLGYQHEPWWTAHQRVSKPHSGYRCPLAHEHNIAFACWSHTLSA
jgi:hypothetical protein